MKNNITIDDIYKVSEDKLVNDLQDDKFYNSLDESGKKELIKQIKEDKHHCAGHVFDKWRGEIKICPTCKKIRVTSCSACGCGNCETCGYRWTCLPQVPIITGVVNWPTLEGRLNQPLTTELEALQQLEKCMPLSEEGKKRLKELIKDV